MLSMTDMLKQALRCSPLGLVLSSLVPRPIPSFSMLHAEKQVCNIEKLGMGLHGDEARDYLL